MKNSITGPVLMLPNQTKFRVEWCKRTCDLLKHVGTLKVIVHFYRSEYSHLSIPKHICQMWILLMWIHVG